MCLDALGLDEILSSFPTDTKIDCLRLLRQICICYDCALHKARAKYPDKDVTVRFYRFRSIWEYNISEVIFYCLDCESGSELCKMSFALE